MNKIPKIKICGITNIEDARNSLVYGADCLGFVFYPESPRYIHPEEARLILIELRKSEKGLREFFSVRRNVIASGIFVNEAVENIKEIIKVADLDIIQLSGTEDIDYIERLGIDKKKILKAVRVKGPESLSRAKKYMSEGVNVLLDAYSPEGLYGGSGLSICADLLKNFDLSSIIIAGGICPDNISSAVRNLMPYGFDLSSRLEEVPGKKSKDKIINFFENVKGALKNDNA